MASGYTHMNLTDVEDSAPKFGLEDVQEARFPTEDVDAEHTGFSLVHLGAGKRQPFGHRHEAAEEVYVVLSGSGRVKLEDDVVELGERDALRVAPSVMRCFEGGPQGLEFLAFGARHKGDGEVVANWWAD